MRISYPILAAGIALAVVLYPCGGSAQTGPSPGELTSRTNELISQGRYDAALAEWTAAIRANRHNPHYFRGRAAVYKAKGDLDRALTDLDEAIALAPKDTTFRIDRGVLYRSRREFDRAIADYTEVLRLDPNAWMALNNRGLVYLEKPDLDRAIGDFLELRRWKPDLAAARLQQVLAANPSPKQKAVIEVALAQPASSAQPAQKAPTPQQGGTAAAAPTAPAQCQIENDLTLEGGIKPDIRWFGECKDGYAEGAGTARWYLDGILRFEQVYSRSNGVIMVRGKRRAVPEVIDQNMQMTMQYCEAGLFGGQTGAVATLQTELAVNDSNVVNYIAERASKFMSEKCTQKNMISWGLSVMFRDKQLLYYGVNKGNGQNSYTNTSAIEKNQQAEAAYRAELHRRSIAAADLARRQAEEEQLRVENAKAALRAAFASKYGAVFVKGSELQTNPFVYKGKVVAVRSSLVRMIAEDEGLFQVTDCTSMCSGWDFSPGFIASKLPSTLLRGQESTVMVIRIVGMKNNLAQGEYVGVHKCAQTDCADLF